MWRGLALLVAPSVALGFGDIDHGANIHNSTWEYAGTPVECVLMHKIDDYGNAWFIHSAGQEMILEVSVNQRYRNEGLAAIREKAPAWVHSDTPGRVEEVPVKTGKKPFAISPGQSQWMLETLQRGWIGQIEHANWGQKNSAVRISINPVNFQKSFRSYQKCIKELLPYTFETVKRHSFKVATKQVGLSAAMSEELDKVAVFLNASPEQYRVTIEAHTDNVGRRAVNQKLSTKRAKGVADYLISKGVPSNIITAKGYGETRPKATNRTKKGRAANRRIEVRLVEGKK